MRAEKSSRDIEGLVLMQLLKDAEYFRLAFPIEAVTALGFERGGSVRGEFAEMGVGASRERFAAVSAASL